MGRNRVMMKALATAGCSAVLAWAAVAPAQQQPSGGDNERPRRTADDSRPPIRRPAPVPLPRRDPPPIGRPNLPPVGTTDRLPSSSPPRQPSRDPQPDRGAPGAGRPDDDDHRNDTRSSIDRARELRDDARRRHGLDESDRYRHRRRPWNYYDHWVYDNNRYWNDRYWDDGYRGTEPGPYGPQEERRAREAAAGGQDGADRPGALLPPDDLMDDADAPAALKKALEASPQYREATARLLRAWAAYARAAEQVLQRLRATAPYRKALADLRQAEAKVEAVRERDRGAPALNLVTAAQQAMLARREVRALEEKAIDADPVARRAKEEVDEAVEHRNKIRDDIAASLPAEDPG